MVKLKLLLSWLVLLCTPASLGHTTELLDLNSLQGVWINANLHCGKQWNFSPTKYPNVMTIEGQNIQFATQEIQGGYTTCEALREHGFENSNAICRSNYEFDSATYSKINIIQSLDGNISLKFTAMDHEANDYIIEKGQWKKCIGSAQPSFNSFPSGTDTLLAMNGLPVRELLKPYRKKCDWGLGIWETAAKLVDGKYTWNRFEMVGNGSTIGEIRFSNIIDHQTSISSSGTFTCSNGASICTVNLDTNNGNTITVPFEDIKSSTGERHRVFATLSQLLYYGRGAKADQINTQAHLNIQNSYLLTDCKAKKIKALLDF